MNTYANINSFKIIYLCKVGILNEKKANILAKEFEADFPTRVVNQQPVPIMFLANNNNGESIIIEPERITYQVTGDKVDPNFENIKDKTAKLFDILLVDENCNAAIDIIGFINTDKDSFSESLEKFNKFQLEGMKGIGLRFFYEEGPDLWDFKIEPFIADSTKYFTQLIGSISPVLHINNIVDIAQNTFSDYGAKCNNIVQSLKLK